nr:efflux RND transporter periplasmic adaptor subunit [uncultured Desulfuromonas sp.]
MKKMIISGLIVCVIGAAGFMVVQKKHQLAKATQITQRPVAVRMAEVKRGSLILGHSYLSEVEAERVCKVSSRVTSSIVKIAVTEGDQVHQGQPLIQLDDSESKAIVAETQAQLKERQAQFTALKTTLESQKKNLIFWQKEAKRDRYLAEQGAIAKAQADATIDRLDETKGRVNATEYSLQAIEAQISAAEKRLNQASIRLSYATLTAPFAGVIRNRIADPGDLATPGTVLMEVEDDSTSKLVFTVPQDETHLIHCGTSVTTKGLPTSTNLHISRIHPALNQDRTLTVEVDLPSDLSIRAGRYLPVDVAFETLEDVLLVPEGCLIPIPQGKTAVFIVEDGVTHPVVVQCLAVKDNMAAIEGIPVGTKVVQSTFLGWNRLAGGERVEVVE